MNAKNCYKLPCVEQKITKLDWKSTIYTVVKLSSYFCVQYSLGRGTNKPPFSISVNLSDSFKTQMKQKKHSFCMIISQSVISCMVYLIMVDMSFNTYDFLVSSKFRCQILLQRISGGTNNVIHHALTLEKLEKKSSLIQFHVLPCN